MSYRVIIPVATEPVSLAEARLHLRIDSDVTSEDALITAWITSVREYAEHYTGRALAPQTLEMALDSFPALILLDMPPVATITSIKYTDTAGVEQTLAANQYALSLYGDSRIVTPAYDVTWPDTQAIADAVRVLYVTGYTTCPKAAKAAILLMVGHLYENRQDVIADVRVNAMEVPNGAKSLLDTLKVWSV